MMKIYQNKYENVINKVVKENGKIISINGKETIDAFEAHNNYTKQIVIPFKEYNTDYQYKNFISNISVFINQNGNLLSLKDFILIKICV